MKFFTPFAPISHSKQSVAMCAYFPSLLRDFQKFRKPEFCSKKCLSFGENLTECCFKTFVSGLRALGSSSLSFGQLRTTSLLISWSMMTSEASAQKSVEKVFKVLGSSNSCSESVVLEIKHLISETFSEVEPCTFVFYFLHVVKMIACHLTNHKKGS